MSSSGSSNEDDSPKWDARHLAQAETALYDARSSFEYRLGAALVNLVRGSGRRRGHLRELGGLVGEARRVRRGAHASMPTWGSAVRLPIRVGTILDEFTHQCLGPEFTLVPLVPRQQLPPDLDFILAESAWRGNGGRWTGAFTRIGSAQHRSLETLAADARRLGIPTVFWNKEDPPNFLVFADAAALFDYVFTTDSGSVADYRQMLGHDQVSTMSFAAQPRLHNPIGTGISRATRVAFAGSFRSEKYPDRARQAAYLLGAAQRRGVLDIYSREGEHDERFGASIVGSLPYDEMCLVYRRYAAFLNLNTVSDSPTMVSRRVFEIAASRTPVLSTPSRAIAENFADLALIASSDREATTLIERLVEDLDYRRRVAHKAYRSAHLHHTYGHRTSALLEAAGISAPARDMATTAMVWVGAQRVDVVIESLRDQVQPPTAIVLVLQTADEQEKGDVAKQASAAGLEVEVFAPGRPVDECLREAATRVTTPYIAIMHGDHYYGPHYLQDAHLALAFSESGVVGKATFFGERAGGNRVELVGSAAEFSQSSDLNRWTIVAGSRPSPMPGRIGTSASGYAGLSTSIFNYAKRDLSAGDGRSHIIAPALATSRIEVNST